MTIAPACPHLLEDSKQSFCFNLMRLPNKNLYFLKYTITWTSSINVAPFNAHMYCFIILNCRWTKPFEYFVLGLLGMFNNITSFCCPMARVRNTRSIQVMRNWITIENFETRLTGWSIYWVVICKFCLCNNKIQLYLLQDINLNILPSVPATTSLSVPLTASV